MFTDASSVMLEKPANRTNRKSFSIKTEPILEWVRHNNYNKVALQFPDELLGETVRVAAALESEAPEVTWFVLADNTFGSCCPDEITAQHYDAQCIVHFGGACLSKSARLPVYYVEEVESVRSDEVVTDVASAVEAAETFFQKTSKRTQLVVFFPFGASEAKISLEPLLRTRSTASCSIVVCAASVNVEETTTASSFDTNWFINRAAVPRLSADAMSTTAQRFYLVSADPSSSVILPQFFLLEKYLLSHSPAQRALQEHDISFLANAQLLNSNNGMQVSRVVENRLRQRMFNIETIKAARSIGIIVVSLAIEGFRETAELLKALIRKRSQKRVYMIYIGHLNEFKVANFSDTVDCFAVIACPNSKISHFPQKHDNFLKPLVAPVEILIALGACDFVSPHAFTTEFSVLRSLARTFLETSATDADKDKANKEEQESTSLIALRHDGTVAGCASAGALAQLHEKSYIGLDPKIGETAVQETLEVGRSGIARGYATERVNQS